jgi:peptidoglycan/LPS O-acetylase OafA/YrhL
MGAYRFLLSIAVVVMHGGFTVFGFLSGIVAVYSFFILSGYLMTLLIQRHYADPSRIGLFYLDRAARIFPQFLFYLVATLIWISWAPPTNPLITGCNAWKVALNLMIVPMHVFDSVGIQDCMVIFPAWTLGLEFVFYAVIPFILLAPFRLRVGLAMVSIAVFLLSFVGAIDTTVWGYRYLPGTLFVFLAGCAIADPKRSDGILHLASGFWQ